MFFCPFKVFDGSRHVYRFKTVCVDDPNLVFPDEVEKIVISSKGRMNDVSPEVQSFLEYLEGKVSDDPLVKEIEQEIHTVKQRKQEERDYMSYLMNIREEREEAKAEGKAEGKAEAARSLMETLHCTKEKAMELLKIPAELQPKVLALL